MDDQTTTETTTQAPEDQSADFEMATPAEVNRVGTKPAGAASMGVEHPANDPTTNDVEQTAEERLSESRRLAMANHAAEQVANGASLAETSDEEEVA